MASFSIGSPLAGDLVWARTAVLRHCAADGLYPHLAADPTRRKLGNQMGAATSEAVTIPMIYRAVLGTHTYIPTYSYLHTAGPTEPRPPLTC